MGNSSREPYQVDRFIEAPSLTTVNQQQQQRQQRAVGLRPTDGPQDAYKRSVNSRSRRSQNERRSYLMATGHLDREEAVSLTNNSADYNQQVSHSPNRSNLSLQFINNKPSGQQYPAFGDQQIDYADQFNLIHHNINDRNNNFAHNKKKSKSNSGNSLSNNSSNRSSRSARKGSNNPHSSIGNFELTSYTEVSLPMKTSPAFEYLLHNDKRKYKRVYLWLIYIILVSICLGFLFYYSHMLIERLNHKNRPYRY